MIKPRGGLDRCLTDRSATMGSRSNLYITNLWKPPAGVKRQPIPVSRQKSQSHWPSWRGEFCAFGCCASSSRSTATRNSTEAWPRICFCTGVMLSRTRSGGCTKRSSVCRATRSFSPPAFAFSAWRTITRRRASRSCLHWSRAAALPICLSHFSGRSWDGRCPGDSLAGCAVPLHCCL